VQKETRGKKAQYRARTGWDRKGAKTHRGRFPCVRDHGVIEAGTREKPGREFNHTSAAAVARLAGFGRTSDLSGPSCRPREPEDCGGGDRMLELTAMAGGAVLAPPPCRAVGRDKPAPPSRRRTGASTGPPPHTGTERMKTDERWQTIQLVMFPCLMEVSVRMQRKAGKRRGCEFPL